MVVKFVGKCLLIEEDKTKVLVVGDIHIGYGVGKEAIGAIINIGLYAEMMKDLEMVFTKVGEVDKVVLLGDLKHSFTSLETEERHDLVNLFDYLGGKSKELVIIKGNHDNYISSIASKREIKVLDYYLWKEYCFLHGDKDFKEIHSHRINFWVMGHLHPAIKLREGNKVEKYKCFLTGNFKEKKIIILPGFTEAGEGIDVRELDRELPWDFDLGNFEVFVVSGETEALEFGKLKKIK